MFFINKNNSKTLNTLCWLSKGPQIKINIPRQNNDCLVSVGFWRKSFTQQCHQDWETKPVRSTQHKPQGVQEGSENGELSQEQILSKLS